MTNSKRQSVLSKEAAERLDSIVRAQTAAQFERISELAGETITDVVVFDTEKPATDSTGVPPVKAIIHRERRQTQRSHEASRSETASDVIVARDSTGASTEQTGSEQIEEKKPSSGTGVLKIGIGLFLTAVSIIAISIICKRK